MKNNEKNKKVYCGDCKHYQDRGHFSDCYYVVNIIDTPVSQIPIYAECEKHNKNNNCKYYKSRKWF